MNIIKTIFKMFFIYEEFVIVYIFMLYLYMFDVLLM
jgi:hypothetical protein